MNKITFFVLLVLSIGLCSYVYFYEIKGEADRMEAADAEKQLFKLSKDEVSSVSVQGPKGTFTFVQTNKQWKMTEPVEAAADATAVEDVIYALDALRITKTVKDKAADLTSFGLGSPKFEVKVVSGSTEVGLKVGDDSPFGGSVYIQKTGEDKVYLSSYPLAGKFDKDLVGWRDKKILDFAVPDVTRVSIQGPEFAGLTATLKDGRWRGDPDASVRLDRSKVESLLYDLQGLRVKSFTGQSDGTAFELDPPSLTVILETGTDKTTRKILVGKPYGQEGDLPLVREVGEEVRLVVASSIDGLKETPLDLLATDVIDLDKAKVQRVEITAEGQTLTAVKENETWKLDGTLKETATVSDLEAILDDIVQLKFEGSPLTATADQLPLYGLEAPLISLVLVSEGTAAPTRIRLGRGSGVEAEKVFCQVEGDPAIYSLNKFILDDIRELLLKKPASTPPGQETTSPSPSPAP